MANGDDLVPWSENPRRVYIQPGPNRPRIARRDAGPYADDYHYPYAAQEQAPAGGPELVPPPPREVPPPRAESTTEPVTPSYGQQLREARTGLYGELHQPRKTGWGRVGQVLGTIGQDIGTAMAPEVMAAIPGTTLNRRLELEKVSGMLGQEQEREAQRSFEQQRLDIARQSVGLPEVMQGDEFKHYNERGEPDAYTVQYKGKGFALVPLGQSMPQNWDAAVEAGYALPGGAMPTTPAAGRALPVTPPAQAPAPGAPLPRATTPGTIPPVSAAPPVPPPAAAAPAGRYGKPAPGRVPLTDAEVAQQQAANEEYWRTLEPTKPYPKALTLGPGATKDDVARIDQTLKSMESARGLAEQRSFTNEMARDRQQREAEAQKLRDQAANEKMVRGVDNNNKVHYMSQGDFNRNKDDYHPNPMSLAPGEYDKAIQSASRVNEMQGRMNALAEAARGFNWNDSGQKSIVTQLLNQINQPSWLGKTLGVEPLQWLSQNFFTRPGAEGATPETRRYIIALLSTREAMLALPKEITEGSRMTEIGTAALWSTLPSGITPNYAWAMEQMRYTQGILDRDRGTKVPIIDGMLDVKKIPDLYQHAYVDKKTGERIYSDDKREWVDENGNPRR